MKHPFICVHPCHLWLKTPLSSPRLLRVFVPSCFNFYAARTTWMKFAPADAPPKFTMNCAAVPVRVERRAVI